MPDQSRRAGASLTPRSGDGSASWETKTCPRGPALPSDLRCTGRGKKAFVASRLCSLQLFGGGGGGGGGYVVFKWSPKAWCCAQRLCAAFLQSRGINTRGFVALAGDGSSRRRETEHGRPLAAMNRARMRTTCDWSRPTIISFFD
jgi:hypothetical protein